MKLSELTGLTLFLEDKKPTGTYAAAKLSKETKKQVKQYLKDNDIADACDVDDMHCTILFSRKHLPDYTAAGKYDTPIKAKSTGFEIWKSKPKEGESKNVLVLTLKSKEMTARHKELMKEHDATYDFDQYKPHVTFCYDFKDGDPKKLSKIDFDIIFDTEYSENLSI